EEVKSAYLQKAKINLQRINSNY
ncbi:dUTPase, partial [Sulfolobus sp. A20-N-F8]